MKLRKDLTGQTVGVFRIKSFAGRNTDGHALWATDCPGCGAEFSARANNLENQQSCGCLTNAILSAAQTTHGQKYTPEYYIWKNMIARCHDQRDKEFHNYGGRGITVCERWRTSVLNFIEDMGRRPSMDHQIDRFPSNDGPYEPGNCRWATRSENANNKRNNRIVEFNGRRQTLTQWASEIGIKPDTLGMRLLRGWPVERALTEGTCATSV